MTRTVSRREVLGMAPAACGVAALLGFSPAHRHLLAGDNVRSEGLDDGFPRQDLDAVEEIVTYSHFHLERVKQIVSARPALAKASWDWGFGDWEMPIGAASHKGRQDMAELLMKFGARPTLFTFAMSGHLDVVRAAIEAQPGIQKIHGPHGFTLMYHARAGGPRAERVVRYLAGVGDADLTGTDLKIPQEEKKKIIGTYNYGPQATDRIEVLEERGELRIKRSNRVGRRLVRVGPLEYHPTGAPAVRVRFGSTDTVARDLTIVDAKVSVQAARAFGS